MMEMKRHVLNVTLDPEEQELLDSIERGEWKSIENLNEELALAKKAAAHFLHKDK